MIAYVYLLIAVLRTAPPYFSKYAGRSVPPPPKLILKGLRTIIMNRSQKALGSPSDASSCCRIDCFPLTSQNLQGDTPLGQLLPYLDAGIGGGIYKDGTPAQMAGHSDVGFRIVEKQDLAWKRLRRRFNSFEHFW